MTELKEKNNLLLWFYRFNTTKIYEYPKLCPLAWGGLMGIIFFITSPLVNLITFIKAKYYGDSFLQQVRDEGNSGLTRFVFNLLIIGAYLMFVLVVASANGPYDRLSDIPNWIYYYGWILAALGLSLVLTIVIGGVYLTDSLSGSDNIKTATQAIKSKYESLCPEIKWIKKDEDD